MKVWSEFAETDNIKQALSIKIRELRLHSQYKARQRMNVSDGSRLKWKQKLDD